MIKKYKSFLIKIILVILAIIIIRSYQQMDVAEGKAPTFLTKSITGAELSVNPPHKSTTIVRFWATWCSICTLENSNFQALIDDNVPVFNIAWQSGSDQTLLTYAKKNHLDSRSIINDRFGVLANRYGVKATPSTFVINRKGEITFSEVGYITELGLRLRLWWTNLQH